MTDFNVDRAVERFRERTADFSPSEKALAAGEVIAGLRQYGFNDEADLFTAAWPAMLGEG